MPGWTEEIVLVKHNSDSPLRLFVLGGKECYRELMTVKDAAHVLWTQ